MSASKRSRGAEPDEEEIAKFGGPMKETSGFSFKPPTKASFSYAGASTGSGGNDTSSKFLDWLAKGLKSTPCADLRPGFKTFVEKQPGMAIDLKSKISDSQTRTKSLSAGGSEVSKKLAGLNQSFLTVAKTALSKSPADLASLGTFITNYLLYFAEIGKGDEAAKPSSTITAPAPIGGFGTGGAGFGGGIKPLGEGSNSAVAPKTSGGGADGEEPDDTAKSKRDFEEQINDDDGPIEFKAAPVKVRRKQVGGADGKDWTELGVGTMVVQTLNENGKKRVVLRNDIGKVTLNLYCKDMKNVAKPKAKMVQFNSVEQTGDAPAPWLTLISCKTGEVATGLETAIKKAGGS
eukprot:Clim_evm10s134 gene=Clim_evmTU10s134